MRNPFPPAVEAGRLLAGRMGSSYGLQFGAFMFMHGSHCLQVIASNGDDWKEAGLSGHPWEHVSVSLAHRCPTWEEMVFVADLFWDPSETLIQFRPAADQYRNCHPYCLHWWRPVGVTFPTPPAETVAPASRADHAT
jgi:hypothetical protein